MSSIPLVALSVRPTATAPELTGQQMQLRNLAGQNAMIPGQLQEQQQRVQSGDIQLQQQQQQLKDQKAITSAWQQWDGKDYNDLPVLVVKNGGSGMAAQQAVQHILDVKTKASEIAKNDAAAGTSLTDNQIKQNDEYRGRLQSIINAPTDQKQALWDAEITKEEQSRAVQPGQMSHTYPGDGTATAMANHFALGSKITQEAQDQQKANAADWKELPTLGVIVNTRTNEVRTPAGTVMSPQMMEAQYVKNQQQQGLGQPLTPDQQAFNGAFEKMKALVPAAQFNLQNQGATGAPGKPSAIAQGLADGTMKWQDVVSARTPMSVKQAILSEVKGIKPDYNSGDFALEQGVKKEFTSGDAAKNLTAFNTAIEHANQLSTATDALDNGNIRALNQIGNTLGYQFGSDKTTNFNVIKNALSGEISKVFKGGGATDAEIEAVQQPFSTANSPAQLKGAIKTAIALMNSKREALQQQYASGVQAKPNFGGGAQGGGQTQGGAPSTSGMTRIKASDGRLHDIPSGALDQAKKIDPGLQVIQ